MGATWNTCTVSVTHSSTFREQQSNHIHIKTQEIERWAAQDCSYEWWHFVTFMEKRTSALGSWSNHDLIYQGGGAVSDLYIHRVSGTHRDM